MARRSSDPALKLKSVRSKKAAIAAEEEALLAEIATKAGNDLIAAVGVEDVTVVAADVKSAVKAGGVDAVRAALRAVGRGKTAGAPRAAASDPVSRHQP